MRRCRETRSARCPLDAGGRFFDLVLRVADPNELIERLERVDVEGPVEVVDLVLKGAGEELLAFDPELATVAVARLDRDLRGAPDLGNIARDREATLPVELLARRLHDLRVDELGDHSLDLDDRDLERHPHLVRRETDARGIAHRDQHVVKQPMKARVERRDSLRALAKDRLLEGEDGADGGHGARHCTESHRRDSGSTSMATPGGTRSRAAARVAASGARTTTWNRCLPARLATYDGSGP